jgi:hypothetical protein
VAIGKRVSLARPHACRIGRIGPSAIYRAVKKLSLTCSLHIGIRFLAALPLEH